MATNTQYIDALKVIENIDRPMLEQGLSILTDLIAAMNTATEELTTLKNELPEVDDNATVARTHFVSLVTQVQSLTQQTTYLKTSVETLVSKYETV